MKIMNVLKRIIDMGVLIEPSVAGKITEMGEYEIERLIERIKKEKPLVINESFFENVFEVIEKKFEKKEYTVQEMVSSYNRYYQKMSSFFQRKRNTVSISNAFGEVSLIGVVKDVNGKEVELEDPTGVIKAQFREEVKLIRDEVILVSGVAKGKKIYVDFLEYPDVKKTLKLSGKECAVCLNGDCGDYRVFFGDEAKIEKDCVIVGSTPVYIKVNGVLLLAFRTEEPIEVLKRRNLQPGNMIAENMIIEEVPDYFLTFSKPFVRDYNGVRIVGANKDTFAKIDLHTGKVEIGKSA